MNSNLINGIRVYAPRSRKELIDHAFQHKSILIAMNAEKILHATDHIRVLVNRNVGYPDGFGAVLGLRRKGESGAIKVPGCELWLDIVKRHYLTSTFYLIGGKPSVIEDTVERLREEFPGIKILNFRDGFIKDSDEKNALIEDMVQKRPDVVFVAMGSPKQEQFMEEAQKYHRAVYQGLGGSFDVYTGRVRRAPSWWIRGNLEWLYRLLQEPARIVRQVHLVRFLMNIYTGRF